MFSCTIYFRVWPETASDIRPGVISGFKELFALANNTRANTCVYLFLMRPGYYLVRPIIIIQRLERGN